ncbi:MAG: hypothetical protein KA746_04760 [Pyrinomonadaceae bacterium]|nr:hypothetical protein [Pyrinomonadaceae bacterium]MBP6213204.1 hypothetical protein [Pyrinomonadaceae bacterium]
MHDNIVRVAVENGDQLRSTAAFRKLGDMAGRLRKLERQVFGDEKK